MTTKKLFDIFYNTYVLNRLKPNTVRGYYINIYHHILPYFNDFDIESLAISDIDSFVLHLRVKKLSNTSIRYVLAVFRKCFSFAVKRGYLKTNIFYNYDFPKCDVFFYNTLSEGELNKLCHYLENDDIYPCVLLASFYGMRKGEILALKRDNVIWNEDLQSYIVVVNKSITDVLKQRQVTNTKTSNSSRTIILSQSHSVNLQRYICLRDLAGDDYLVSSFDGYITSNQLMYRFKKALSDLKLPDIRFHDLRHSYATFMLRKGVHPKVISSVLGHSDISTTLDIYSHYDTFLQKACIDVINEL